MMGELHKNLSDSNILVRLNPVVDNDYPLSNFQA